MSERHLSIFHRKRMAECLTGLAHLCEKAASLSWNEDVAIEFEGLARDCVGAAIKEERTSATTRGGKIR
jgi:hypothetical protein